MWSDRASLNKCGFNTRCSLVAVRALQWGREWIEATVVSGERGEARRHGGARCISTRLDAEEDGWVGDVLCLSVALLSLFCFLEATSRVLASATEN
jgi:hypothetical protein